MVFVPGIGSAAGAVLAGAASLASGKSLDEAALDAAAGAIPGGIIAKTAFQAGRDLGGALLDGQDIDAALLAAGRGQARLHGGELGAAAFDAALILARGQALQDAGFAALKGFARGNTLAERSIAYAEKVARAAQEGRPVAAVLVDDLAADLRDVAGPALAQTLGPMVERVAADPTLRELGSEAFAFAEGVDEPIARAAQAVVGEDGTIDRATLYRFLQIGATERAIIGQGQAAILTADPRLLFSYRAPVAAGALVFDPAMTWSAQHPTAKAAPAIVAAVAPPVESRSPAKAIAGGLAVAAALGGLYLWATDGGRT